jgi:hypothetical protein
MNDRTFVRWLVVGELVLPLLAAIADVLEVARLSPEIQVLIEGKESWLDSPIGLALGLLFLAVTLIALVGLFFMQPWSGLLYLIVTGISIPATALLPATYESGLSSALNALGIMCSGGLVAMILLGRVPYVGRPTTAS